MAIISGVKKISASNDAVFMNTIQLPTMITRQFRETEHDLDVLEIDKLSRAEINTIAFTALGDDIAAYPGIFEDRDTKVEIKTKTDTRLCTQYPTTKGKKGSLSQRRTKTAVRAALGMSGMKQICLPHSGFWITIDAIPRVDRFVLLEQLAEREIELSTDTATLIYSAPRAIYIRLLMDFVSDFIVDHTISLDENDDIMDYINVLDIDVMVLEIVKSFYTDGFSVSMACKNSTVVKGKSIACDYAISGKIDLNEVYRFDEGALSEEQIDMLSRRGSGSVTKEEQAKFIDEFTLNDSSITVVLNREENNIEIKLQQASINSYLLASDKYISELSRQVDKVLMGDENPIARKSKLENIAKDLILSKYMHFVSSISANGDTTTNIASIYDALNVIMDDEEHSGTIMKELINFLDSHVCAMTCTPSYTCPKCRKNSNGEGTRVKGFTGMIPLDILEVFTSLRSKSL